ncbi:MAG TPA: aminotransferase class I/II-fold pyridoxal phosphate-dependent enzyme [Victivallales bacterium]|nr:aminotransferase class I/II-fold pyridoxal phosphate-dependent enzyme [Victivallales bacterium]
MSKKISELAEGLNKDMMSAQNCAYELLSEKGRRIFFPFKGILGQSAEAKSSKINATIGTAFEEDGSALCLECVEELVNVPSEAFLYAPSFGIQKLREIWKDLLYKKNPSMKGKAISMPVISSALTHALSVCGYLFVDEGDEIVLPDLNWDNYDLIFSHGFGASLVTYQTFSGGGYNVSGMEKAISETKGNKKIVLLNFPNNPTGYTVTKEEAVAIRDSLLRTAEKGNKILVIMDDAYFGLVYEKGIFEESLFSYLCDIHPNVLAVKLDGPTKEDYVWSFRVGFITFGIRNSNDAQLKALESKTAGVIRGNISNCSGIAQAILMKAYQNKDYSAQKEQKLQVLKKRYEKIKGIISENPQYVNSFEVMPFNSGYFMCVKPIGVDPENVRKELIANYGTGVIVLSGLLRIAFSAVPTDKLDALFNNIHSAISKLKK